MAPDLRRQTINDATNAMLSCRRLARALIENPRNPQYPDEERAAKKLTDAAHALQAARDELELPTTQG